MFNSSQSFFNINKKKTTSAASIKSTAAFSMARQKRIRLMMKQHNLPDFETKVFCEYCEKYIETRIRYRNGSMVWLTSFILYVMTCNNRKYTIYVILRNFYRLLCTIILFWVPFYVKYFKDVAHYCPGCGKRLGVFYRI
ncbi:uncharacterized protein BX663DRAFT_514316 [Cokeromyces recurvatus]|uniref:uncharacterized protein n=1 Tax=Cokeromyces recurvatus TaxID=90255 RepID=UPI00221EA6A4|nr:uncharacterized protein BX663DRAFT_514316 [Cokeromyces recurvatus]KAI7901400.1 hypothetical protein BX663DRAFT_514316 [Cokeromyces recurvatus]